MEERKHIVILAAGDFPTHEVPLRALREADFVVCCDSAYSSLISHHSSPSTHHSSPITHHSSPITNLIVIGDGDSLSDSDKRALGDRWLHVAEQDYNDLHKALQWATSKFKIQNSKFKILGATGRREDHTLGNISYLVTFAEEHPGIDIEMLTDHGRFIAFSGGRTIETFPGQQVSVFSMDPCQAIYGSGLKWKLDGLKARRWWQATLNEALADSVELRSEGWLMVFLKY